MPRIQMRCSLFAILFVIHLHTFTSHSESFQVFDMYKLNSAITPLIDS